MDTEKTITTGEPSRTDDGEEALTGEETQARDGGAGGTSSPGRTRSRRDFGSVGCLAAVLAAVLLFGWLIVSAIIDVAKEDREREAHRRQNLYSYRSPTQRASSGRPSSGSSSSGSSGGAYKPKQSSGGGRKDEYNAADFRNAEDFYDEHYDDFFDHYDAEDYWNEHN